MDIWGGCSGAEAASTSWLPVWPHLLEPDVEGNGIKVWAHDAGVTAHAQELRAAHVEVVVLLRPAAVEDEHISQVCLLHAEVGHEGIEDECVSTCYT